MKALENKVRRTSPRARRSAWWWEKCPGATSCTVMAGSVLALNTSSHASTSFSGHDSSGGVIQYQDGASGSAGALVEIIAIAQRRDSGDSGPGTSRRPPASGHVIW